MRQDMKKLYSKPGKSKEGDNRLAAHKACVLEQERELSLAGPVSVGIGMISVTLKRGTW
jgi:ABC-type Fe3+-citrate transport system substrate-binding protein